MAASVLRPLAVRFHHTARLYPKMSSRMNNIGMDVQNKRALWTRGLLSNDTAASLPSPVQGAGEERMRAGNNFFQELRSLGSVEEVLVATSQRTLSGNEASVAVSALRRVGQSEVKISPDVLRDERFRNLSVVIAKNVKKLSNESLTSSLANSFHLQTQDDDLILALEEECRRRLRLLPVWAVAVIVCNDQLLSTKAETKALVTEAARVLELRWREIEDRQLVRRLLPAASRISNALLERVEDKTLELLSQFSFQEIAALTKTIVATKTRSLPILRAISYQLLEQRSTWEIAPLLDIMSSMGNLGFHNPALFREFTSHIQQRIDECPVDLLCDVAKTYAALRFQAADLLDVIHRIAAASVEELATLDVKRLLFAYSQFCYHPPSADAFYEKVGSVISARFNDFSSRDQIDLAHSLAVLQKVPENMLEKVLHPVEGGRDQDAGEAVVPPTPKLKLIQINSYAELEVPSYNGPVLAADHRAFPPNHQLFTTSLHRSVMSVLRASLKEDHFTVAESVKSELGYVIDAEISGTTDSNSQKVALVTLGPPCYLYLTRQLIGRIEMMLRHLRLAGYQVLEIPYHDWYPLNTHSLQNDYLSGKLNEVLQ